MTSNINLASLTSVQGFKITGANGGDQSGYSVSTGGDINGDGYDDIVIGAPVASSNNGITYVVFGKANGFTNIDLASLNSSQVFAITGSGGFSGIAVDIAGDINNDGFADILISKLSSSTDNMCYVIFGHSGSFTNINLASLALNQGFSITGINPDPNKPGKIISWAGDVNKDGYDDIVIGTPGVNSNTGAAYIIFGKASGFTNIALSSLTPSSGIKITGANNGDLAGWSVAGAGDVNKDNYDDVIIGAPGVSSNAGMVYILFGGKTLTNINLASITAEQGFYFAGCNTDQTGLAVTGADINADMHSDIIFASPAAYNRGGVISAIYGTMISKNLDCHYNFPTGTAGGIFDNRASGTYLGYSVNKAGDVNGDGFNDYIIGELGIDSGVGISYVIYGSTNPLSVYRIDTLSLSQGFSITGENAWENSGWSVSGEGDINGDGYADIVIGAIGANSGAGATYVVFGSASGFVTPSLTKTPTQVPTISPTTTLQSGLVAYYPFNGNANDATGNGNDGVVHSATLVADRFGNSNSAYSFDGSSSYIKVNDGTQFNFANDMSISIWVKPTTNVLSGDLISKSHAYIVGWAIQQLSANNMFAFFYRQLTSSWSFDAGTWSGAPYTQLAANQWNHLIVIKQDAAATYYLNGVSVNIHTATSAIIKDSSNLPLYIGATNTTLGTVNYFNGSIDDIKIYNRVLTASEVQQLYMDGDKTATLQTGLVAYYPFSGNADDMSGNSNNGTVHSTTLVSDRFGNANSAYSFNGASSYIKINDGTQFDFANSFSISLWVKPYATQVQYATLLYKSFFSGASWGLGQNEYDNNLFKLIYVYPAGTAFSNFTQLLPNQWNHFVITKHDYELTTYLNGNKLITIIGPSTEIVTNGNLPLYIGSGPNIRYFNGYIDDIFIYNRALSSREVAELYTLVPNLFTWTPTVAPTYSFSPTPSPTASPTIKPTKTPTAHPTHSPTKTHLMASNIDLASLSSSQGFVIYGEGSSATGQSVSAAGDVNGDGYLDIVIGAPDLNNDIGKVYIIFGQSSYLSNIHLDNLTSVQGFYISGADSHTSFGRSISGAGDINKDGYADLIIGAPGDGSVYYTGAGISYIIFGNKTNSNINLASIASSLGALSSNIGISISGANSGDKSGYSVSNAGDVNGDGFDDVIIGAPYASSSIGMSYLIFGNTTYSSNLNLASIPISQGFSMIGAANSDNRGYAVSIAGDINSDGYADIIIGAPYGSPQGKTGAGTVYVILGKANWNSNINLDSSATNFYTMGANAADNSGFSVNVAGDVNGDGYIDLIIGAPGANSGQGTAYVIYGKSSFSGSIDLSSLTIIQGFSISLGGPGDKFGYSVASAGDVNQDGYDDVIIGSIGVSYYGKSSSGAAYVIFGRSSGITNIVSLDPSQGFAIYGATANDQLGISVNAAGDINNDGYGDIIIGATGANSGTGAAYVIYGNSFSTTPPPTVTPTITPTIIPTVIPTLTPTISPTQLPTATPTINPSAIPTVKPTTALPTVIPLITPTIAPTTPLENGLVAYYPFNGNANDATYHGNDGVIYSATLVPDRFGVINSAYSFDGSNSYIKVSNGTIFNFNNSFSVSLWVKPTSSQVSVAAIMDKGNFYPIPSGWAIQQANVANAQRLMYYPGGRAGEQTPAAQLVANEWNYFAVIKHDSTIKGYLNGVQVATISCESSIITPNGDTPLVFGAVRNYNTESAVRYFTGFLDDIRIYNRTLTANEVQQLYTYGAPTPSPTHLPTKTATDVNNIELSNLYSTLGISITGVGQAGYATTSGDINGDGISDIVIGAPGINTVYVIYGNSSYTNLNLANINNFGFSITGSNEQAGYAIDVADINGDGKSDIIIGAPSYLSNTGRVYVVYGIANSSNVDLTNLGNRGISITGINTNDDTGRSVSSADINGDGKDDIIIAATSCLIDSTCTTLGKVHVIFGSNNLVDINLTNLTPTQGISITGAAINEKTGYAVSGAGDINRDGFDDFIIIAYPSKSYVIYGNSTFSNIDLFSFSSTQGFIIIGDASFAISGVGDINNDGYDDISVVVAYSINIIFGKANSFSNIDLGNLGSQGFSIDSSSNIAYPHYTTATGRPLGGAGDVNGDGYDDIIFGSHFSTSNAKGYIIFGKPSGFANIALDTITISQGIKISTSANIGWSAASAGDFNNDGYADVIIGSNNGLSYILYGNQYQSHAPTLTPTVSPTLAPTHKPTMPPRWFSNVDLAHLNNNQGIAIYGANNGDSTGWAVSKIGDFNGDSYDDVIIGAPDARNRGGASYVIFGKLNGLTNINVANLDVTQGFAIINSANMAYSGFAISGAGDINKDGYDDIIISSSGAMGGMLAKIYVIFGKPSGFSTIELSSLSTTQGFTIFGGHGYGSGNSVSCAGDINGDGYADIIIGSPNKGGDPTNVSYVIFGKQNNFSDIELETMAPNQGFAMLGLGGDGGKHTGGSVSGVGDVNGDGYDDVIIGSKGYPGGPTGQDRSYVVFGRANISNVLLDSSNIGSITPDQGFYITGNDYSGISVGMANINGDKYTDLIIAAPMANSGQGKIYIIFGNSTLANINLGSITLEQGFAITGAYSEDYNTNTGLYYYGTGYIGYEFVRFINNAGDVNGDEYEDIIIGTYGANSAIGKTYVVFGKANGFSNIDLANLNPSQGYSITGINANDYSGYSVSSAGDFNGDGYDDIIIGSPGYPSGNAAGAAYIIFNSAATAEPTHLPTKSTSVVMNTDLSLLQPYQGFVINGAHADNKAGYSVRNAGDVNGDGYKDIIIGAPGYNSGTGGVYVIFGNSAGYNNIDLANLNNLQGYKITNAATGYNIGNSVSSAGDFNKDGFDDILIGTTTSSTTTGIGYLIFGKPSGFSNIFLNNLTIAQGFSFTGTTIWGATGTSTATSTIVSKAGDVNNDSYADIFFEFIDEVYIHGNNYVIFGKPNGFTNFDVSSLTNTQGFALMGPTTFEPGQSVSISNAGDINGDGFEEIILGERSGVNRVIFGKPNSFGTINLPNMDITQGFTISGGSGAVNSAGDINNDGYDDIIIGDPGAFGGWYYAGVSYILFGKHDNFSNINLANLSSEQGFRVIGIDYQDNSGCAVSGVGDVNGDGYNDIVIGGINAASNKGASYIIFGKANGFTDINLAYLTPNQGFTVTGINIGDHAGSAVSGDGDFNGDGYADYIIGAPGVNNSAGAVYVLYGNQYQTHSPTQVPTLAPTLAPTQIPTHAPTLPILQNINLATLPTSKGITISGAYAHDNSGSSVAIVGDINGDGYADFATCAPDASPSSRINAGICDIIYGGANLNNIDLSNLSSTQGFSIIGHHAHDKIGISVASAGDVNKDSFADIIIGSRDYSKTYVLYGGNALVNIDLASLTPSQGFTITNTIDQYFGWSLASVGDVNKDNYTDIIIGAWHGAPFGRTNAGIVYVIFGSAALSNIDIANFNSSYGFAIYGSNVDDYLGYSVSGAGDVNKDGFDDIIVGAGYTDHGGKSNAGTAYIIYGGSNLTNVDLASLTQTQGFAVYGANSGDATGNAVSKAGDINKDGFDDIIIGAPGHSSGKGKAYVICGSNSLSNIDLANLNLIQGFTILAANNVDSLGAATASAVDVNKDGYSDIIIGAPYANNYAGISYVIYGKSSNNNIDLANLAPYQGFALTGPSYGQSGAVSGGGDINKDGYDDIIIGASQTNSAAGSSYVVYGGIAQTAMPTIAPTPAPTLSPTHHPTKSASVIINTDLATLQPYQGFVINGVNAGDQLGYSVCNAGDVNGDGKSDIIIGAPHASSDAGISYVIYGGANLPDINLANFNPTQGFSITGVNPWDISGSAVATAGDVNGDHYDDIIIGAVYVNSREGMSYIIYGGANLTNIDLANLLSTQGFSVKGAHTYDYSGVSVSGAGDINKDGYADVVIGAASAPSLQHIGITYIIYGGKNLSNIELASLTSVQGFSITGAHGDDQSSNGEQSGSSVSGAGDINGDGYADVIIGAPNANSAAGITYVVYGGVNLTNIVLSSLTSEKGFSIGGAHANDNSGFSVSKAGDVNGDGYADIIIGANKANDEAGISYVIFGNKTLTNINLSSLTLTQGFLISGIDYGDYVGYCVSNAGDVNGDGFSDIIIGAPNVNTNRGASYIIFGKASGFASFNYVNFYPNQGFGFSVMGASPHDESGFSVSGAGDFNGDGYADYIIGAHYANSGAGSAYVLYGNQYQTNFPTGQPTGVPTTEPTTKPSVAPSGQPSSEPTSSPTDASSLQCINLNGDRGSLSILKNDDKFNFTCSINANETYQSINVNENIFNQPELDNLSNGVVSKLNTTDTENFCISSEGHQGSLQVSNITSHGCNVKCSYSDGTYANVYLNSTLIGEDLTAKLCNEANLG